MHNSYYPSELGRSPEPSTRAFHPTLAAIEMTVAGPHTPAPVARDALPRPLHLAGAADPSSRLWCQTIRWTDVAAVRQSCADAAELAPNVNRFDALASCSGDGEAARPVHGLHWFVPTYRATLVRAVDRSARGKRKSENSAVVDPGPRSLRAALTNACPIIVIRDPSSTPPCESRPITQGRADSPS